MTSATALARPVLWWASSPLVVFWQVWKSCSALVLGRRAWPWEVEWECFCWN